MVLNNQKPLNKAQCLLMGRTCGFVASDYPCIWLLSFLLNCPIQCYIKQTESSLYIMNIVDEKIQPRDILKKLLTTAENVDILGHNFNVFSFIALKSPGFRKTFYH